jgi:ribosome-binding protein aMBF1 (putative translation factor)
VSHNLVCWKCGASLAELSLPLQRRDECRKCRAELHVCKMCVDYDTRVAKHCREPTAEEVSDKTRANFCGHFAPREGAFTPPNTGEIDKAKAELERLFGKK